MKGLVVGTLCCTLVYGGDTEMSWFYGGGTDEETGGHGLLHIGLWGLHRGEVYHWTGHGNGLSAVH